MMRPSCWHQNFGPNGLSAPTLGLCLNFFSSITADFNISSALRWAIQDQWPSGFKSGLWMIKPGFQDICCMSSRPNSVSCEKLCDFEIICPASWVHPQHPHELGSQSIRFYSDPTKFKHTRSKYKYIWKDQGIRKYSFCTVWEQWNNGTCYLLVWWRQT